ncbi:MAG TPA: TIGR04551 family protein [Polyangiaceae bacterium]|nr:TIGR04551 family protein [Polyangiaceae bacterium]
MNPSRDQQELAEQGAQRPAAGELAASPQDVFSEDWWGRARPVIELHGYFRTRAELLHNFSLGRHGSSLQYTPNPNGAVGDPAFLFPNPIDNTYSAVGGNQGTGIGQTVAVCGSPAAGGVVNGNCFDKTESGANLRLRLDPEIHISDNLRIVSQINLLDNLVLGSTPNSYAMQPTTNSASPPAANRSGSAYPTGYQPAGVNGFAPISFLASTQGPPTAGVNSWTNSINVIRAWGEYMTPVGQLRFGRMPGHWGLGMVENSGDGVDSDYQTTLDRIMFVTGIKSIDLYFGGAWDFVSTGPTNANPFDVYGGQPYNTCNLCNVNEWAAFVAHRTTPEVQRLRLAHGDIVVNGGLYAVFRSQYLDVVAGQTSQTNDPTANNDGLEARQAWALTPDLWLQLLWRKLRVEAEAATTQGQIAVISAGAGGIANTNANNAIGVQQYGVVTQTEFRAIDDKLDLQFGFGWASGDPWAATLAAPSSQALAPPNGLRTELNGHGPLATFEFHPDYRVDLIFYRHILQRVEGSYYFRPSVDYDFVRHADGERLGGGAAAIWSRASEFVQAPGHARDLGVELDAQLYYQSRDGSLNDDPTKIGGFYTMLQYGVFFPLTGLDYLPNQATGIDASLSPAQTVRLFLGIIF